MRCSRFFLILAFLNMVCMSKGFTQDSPQEIVVHLSTANPLQPVYIGKIQTQNPLFDSSYLLQLEAILAYDFNYNGSTQVCQRHADKEQALNHADPLTAFNSAFWKTMGISYAIRLKLHDKVLETSAFHVAQASLKTFPTLQLTGDLKEDRQRLHKLADAIYKALFNAEGIAATRILFAYQVKNHKSDGSEWISEIWECDWDGANARQVTHENSYCVSPVLLSHGDRFGNDKFLYVSYRLGQPKIYIASLKGGEGKRLIDLRGNQLLPALSPQRNKIAFISDAGGRADLFMQSFNPATGDVGKPIQLYSYPRATQASPTFSPDGSRLAFASDKDGGTRIYVLPAIPSEKRGNAVMISKQNKENSCPCWSPDGTKLAYSATTKGIRQIWIYDFVTKEEIQLTSGPGNKENPCWAPDSKHIVFNSTDATNSELYIVNLNQPEAIKITKGPGKKHYPTWGTKN